MRPGDIYDDFTTPSLEKVTECFLEMEGSDAASTLVALLAMKVLQDDPTWKVAEARVKNAVEGLAKIVWEHYHGPLGNKKN
jgi:hypothetical protein